MRRPIRAALQQCEKWLGSTLPGLLTLSSLQTRSSSARNERSFGRPVLHKANASDAPTGGHLAERFKDRSRTPPGRCVSHPPRESGIRGSPVTAVRRMSVGVDSRADSPPWIDLRIDRSSLSALTSAFGSSWGRHAIPERVTESFLEPLGTGAHANPLAIRVSRNPPTRFPNQSRNAGASRTRRASSTRLEFG